MAKPSIPKGTRDFISSDMVKRNYLFNKISEVFKLYGFNQIETPAFENIETLTGKYGDEGDKLIFKILNSGNFLSKITDNEISSIKEKEEDAYKKLSPKIVKKALRYDLTVPFARFVVQHRNDITFPFKRYQIQPVWRADRPAKGRYQEFYQCDVDTIGSDSLLHEVDLIQIIDKVFDSLGINVEIKLNNRKILLGIAEVIGESDKFIDITVAIDKLDKIGLEKVVVILSEKGLSEGAIGKLKEFLSLNGTIKENIEQLSNILSASKVGMKGIEELDTICSYLDTVEIKNAKINLDVTLARGLNYYTGAIIEVKSLDTRIGSICGGGRYDDLTGIFGLPNVSGVGISFGADRIFDVLNELELYPKEINYSTSLMILNFGDYESKYALRILDNLRNKNIASELYPDKVKIQKQMNYANKNNIPYVLFVGEDEIKSNVFTLKDMISGEQIKVSEGELAEKIKY